MSGHGRRQPRCCPWRGSGTARRRCRRPRTAPAGKGNRTSPWEGTGRRRARSAFRTCCDEGAMEADRNASAAPDVRRRALASAPDVRHLDCAAARRARASGARSTGRRGAARAGRRSLATVRRRRLRAALRGGRWPPRRTGRCRAGPRPRAAARVQPPQNGWVTDAMTPTSPRAVEVAPAAGRPRRGSGARPARAATRRRSSPGSRRPGRRRPCRQPLVVPTSMYSISAGRGRCRGSARAMSATPSSLQPALDDHVHLHGRPAAAAASIAVEHAARPGSRRRSSPGTPRRRASRG